MSRGWRRGAFGENQGEREGGSFRTVTSWVCVACGDFYKTRTLTNARRDRLRIRGGACAPCRVRVARARSGETPPAALQIILGQLQLRLTSPS